MAAQDFESEVELGAVLEQATTTGQVRVGPSVAIEMTPFEHWLELELGVSAVHVSGGTEWETSLGFKKAFPLASNTELLVGLGPTWVHSSAAPHHSDAIGAEFVLDFQFWTHRRWGWFVEPSYSVTFTQEREYSIGLTAGILIGLH